MSINYTINPVSWDTKFFGFPVGDVLLPADFSESKLGESLRSIADKYRVVYITVEHDGPNELKEIGVPCPCYDRKVVFSRNVPSHAKPVDPAVYAHTDMTCPKRLEILAVQSGAFSRFLKDPFLSPFYERLYLAWLNQSVSGGTADATWVWTAEDKQIGGLITTRLMKIQDPVTGELIREGRIGMLAVDPKHRNKGAAKAMMGACEYWANSLGITRLTLATQKDNAAVCSLSEKCGYEQVSEQTIYHCWIPGWKYNPRQGWHLSR